MRPAGPRFLRPTGINWGLFVAQSQYIAIASPKAKNASENPALVFRCIADIIINFAWWQR
jgi:hypothetical protein